MIRRLAATLTAALALTLVPATAAPAADVVRLSGDWNGDGRTEPATYDRATATFTGAGTRFRYGRPGDFPLVGDWDGDGRDELGINRGKWMHLRTILGPGTGDVSYWYGHESDTPVVDDWNGDGRDTVSVIRGADLYVKVNHAGGPADYVIPARSYTGARTVLDTHGCADAVLEFAPLNVAGLAYWHETPQRIVLDSRLRDVVNVAAHECGHLRVWDAYRAAHPDDTPGQLEQRIHASLATITGEDGTMGSEVLADCLAVRWGYEPGYLMSTAYCDRFPTATADLDAGRAPTAP